MSRIEKLTDEQIKRMSEFRDKWIDIGLSTDPANRLEAEAGIILAYKIAGLQPPKIVWCGSPLSQGLTRAIVLNLISDNENELVKKIGDSVWASVLARVWARVGVSVKDSMRASVWASVLASVWASVWASVRASVRASVGDSVKDSVRASVWASVRDSVWDSVWASVWDSVWDSVRDSVRASVGDSVRDSVRDSVLASVRDSVRASVWASVRASVGDSVGDSVGASVVDSVWASVGDSVGASVGDSVFASVGDSVFASVGDSGYGQHDAEWLAFYEYFKEACALDEQTQKLTGIWKISKNAGWWLPHEKICWISERHNALHRDQRGRLHHPDKPALTYPDGFSIYSWHGIRIPEKYIITPSDKIDVVEALKEDNSSVRMAVIQKVGFLRFKNSLPHKIISKTNSADLLEFKLDNLNVRGLHVKWQDKFGTPLETIIPVPRTKQQFGDDCPDNIDDAEQVRKWTCFLGPKDSFLIET